MSAGTYFSRLNPAERRFVVIVGLLFFVVINLFWVWPHFSDWSNLRVELEGTRTTQFNREKVIRDFKRIEPELKKLQEKGNVPSEDQATEFLNTIHMQSMQSGMGTINFVRQTTRTNDQFFLERIQAVSVVTGEKQLVDFLLNLSSNQLIRVSSLSAHPSDPNRQQLSANITLVASYQKKPSVHPAPSANPTGTAKAEAGATAPARPGAANPATPKKK
jgi:hypothetical protein